MTGTSTLEARIKGTLMRWNLGSVHPGHGPYESLGRQSAASVAKGQAPVQVGLALPHDCEVREGSWVDLQPAVPPCHVHLEQHDTLIWVLGSNLGDPSNDGR